MYDQVALDETLALVSAERGERVHPYCCFNDMRLVEQARTGPAPMPEQVCAVRDATTLTWAPPQAQVSCRFCLHVSTDDDALVITLTGDTRYLPPPRLAAMLSTMERVVLDSVASPVPLPSVRSLLDAGCVPA